MRQRPAKLGTFLTVWIAAPGAIKKGEDGAGPPRKFLQNTAVACWHWQWAGHPGFCQHFHHLDKERKIRPVHPLFIQRQNVMGAVGAKKIVGIFHPFGDAGKTDYGAKVIGLEKRIKRCIVNIRVYRHEAPTPRRQECWEA